VNLFGLGWGSGMGKGPWYRKSDSPKDPATTGSVAGKR